MAAGTEPPGIEERVAALEATVAMFARRLIASGDITIDDVRAAMGLKPFTEEATSAP